jgi:hypothetical protein
MVNMVQNCQTRIVGIHENVDYSSIIMQSYPMTSIQTEPYFGFKVLMKDMNANIAGSPGNRLIQIEQVLGNPQTAFMVGSGCFLRETEQSMPDGFWLITFPVPRQHLKTQFNNLINIMNILQREFGIIRLGLWELNVSGRCPNTEAALNSLMLPDEYMKEYFVRPTSSAYTYGEVIRINPQFMVLRTRWALPPNKEAAYFDTQPRPGMYNLKSVIMTLCQLIASIYH